MDKQGDMGNTRDSGLLVVVALISRALFLVYTRILRFLPWILVLLVLLLILLVVFAILEPLGYWALAVVAVVGALLLYCAYELYDYAADSLPISAGAGSLVDRLSARFIAWIGTLKYFSVPPCIVEDPGSYKIKGRQVREVLDRIQAGDILLRGYDRYLDGEMIRRTGGVKDSSKYFSHAALYLGPLDATNDGEIVARRLRVLDADGSWRDAEPAEIAEVRDDENYFDVGPQMVIHAMAKGVHAEDILTFLRCDYLAVLRLPDTFRMNEAYNRNMPLVKLSGEAEEIDRRLMAGETVPRNDVVAAAKRSALGQIGSGYDFLFQDSSTFNRFSCSEFAYYCYKSVHRIIGLQPKRHAIMKYFFVRETVSPADIFDALEPKGRLRLVWSSLSQSG